jgi:Skp family chaperone for outer membrane proteins
MTLSSLWFALALVPLAQDGATGSASVAVVNVAVVSEQYNRTSDLEARFAEKRRVLEQQREALQKKIELTARSLQEELKPGTEAYQARRKELAMLEAELQWFLESESRRVEQGLASSLQSIFADIQAAVQKIAEQKGIDIVLAFDRMPEETPETANQARQQILLQKVVYWSPRVDLTAEVISELNSAYRGQEPAPSQGSSRPVQSEGALSERTESGRPINTQSS